jgi:hypothetical protein
MEMKCILNIGKKYFYIGQGYSGERCGPWASCLFWYIYKALIYKDINIQNVSKSRNIIVYKWFKTWVLLSSLFSSTSRTSKHFLPDWIYHLVDSVSRTCLSVKPKMKNDKAIVMFSSVLCHLKIQKPTSQQGRKTNKRK